MIRGCSWSSNILKPERGASVMTTVENRANGPVSCSDLQVRQIIRMRKTLEFFLGAFNFRELYLNSRQFRHYLSIYS